MANFEIFKVTKDYSDDNYGGGYYNYYDLDNGDTIRSMNIGEADSVHSGRSYTLIQRGIGEPDEDGDFEMYEVLGWAYSSDCARDCPFGIIE